MLNQNPEHGLAYYAAKLDSLSERDGQGCLIFKKRKDRRRGYGVITMFSRNERAHRAAWRIFVGPIPQGLYVCHRCDNPSCVNVGHLFLGSQLDNMRDASAKGRIRPTRVRGERHHNASLTEDAVRDIRKRDLRPIEYARKYGCSYDNIWRVQSGRAWPHVK